VILAEAEAVGEAFKLAEGVALPVALPEFTKLISPTSPLPVARGVESNKPTLSTLSSVIPLGVAGNAVFGLGTGDFTAGLGVATGIGVGATVADFGDNDF